MELAAAIVHLDEYLFLLINGLPHPPIVDSIFLFFSFYPLVIWLIVGAIVVVLEERREKLFIIKLGLALILAGLLASGFIKPIIKRPRPDIAHGATVVIVEEIAAPVPWNNDFAFPSGHAAVAFAGAYIVTREETETKHAKKHSKGKRKLMKYFFFGFALLTAFSRIYLGKHYPLDVFAGGILGWIVGWVSWQTVDFVKVRL